MISGDEGPSIPAPGPLSEFVTPASILNGDTADVYFLRTRTILEHAGLNPVVTFELFSGGNGILCGIDQALSLLREVLGPGDKVWAVPEGEPFQTKDVALRIRARYNPVGLYETALLGMLAHASGWATAARECVDAAAGKPVISFGARHVHPLVSPIMEYAAIVGGCAGCATPAGARLARQEPVGTMPHAMILIFGDTVRAAEAFDRYMPPGVARLALVDTFKDEAEESLRVAQALGDRLDGVRLDTPAERGRVTPDLVKEVRARLDQAGFPKVKITVSGGLTPDRIREFNAREAPVDVFAVGSYISGARPMDFTADIKAIEDRPIAKRGRIPGIMPNPRLRPVSLWD